MGAVQKLATVVIVGLTGLATLLVFMLADEKYRRDAEADEQEEVAIERGIQTFVVNCLSCHGPAGEGSNEPGRIGRPIGGNTQERLVNQSDDPVIRDQREQEIRLRIHGGQPIGCGTTYPNVGCLMPPWGNDFGGELNDEQIEELVIMIQNVDWDLVYNEAIDANGGYPTPPVTPPAEETATATPTVPTVTLEAKDIGWLYEDQPGPRVDLTLAPGTVIDLVNTGRIGHNFELADFGISVDMPPGETVQATIPPDAPAGTYNFICNVTGHAAAGMVGTIMIDPNAAPAAAPAGEASPDATPGASPEAAPVASPGAPPAATTEASPAASPAASPVASPTALSEVTVEAYDIGWRVGDQPGPTVSFAVTPGATITVVNTGALGHNFSISALGISVDPLPGETVTVEIPDDVPPGNYEFICAVPGHAQAGMRGTITIP